MMTAAEVEILEFRNMLPAPFLLPAVEEAQDALAALIDSCCCWAFPIPDS